MGLLDMLTTSKAQDNQLAQRQREFDAIQKERRDAQMQSILDAGKAADFAVKANPGIRESLGLDEKGWQSLGAREKALGVEGYLKSIGAQEAVGKLESVLSQNRGDAALQKVVGESGRVAPQGTMTDGNQMFAPGFAPWNAQRAPNRQQLAVESLSRNPAAIHSPSMSNFQRMLEADPQENLSINFQEDPTSGTRFATFGKQIMPSGVNPDKASTGKRDYIKEIQFRSLQSQLAELNKAILAPTSPGQIKDYKLLRTERDRLEAELAKFQNGGGEEPAAAPASAQVRRYNPATGKLE